MENERVRNRRDHPTSDKHELLLCFDTAFTTASFPPRLPSPRTYSRDLNLDGEGRRGGNEGGDDGELHVDDVVCGLLLVW